jgi:hypothetical protein
MSRGSSTIFEHEPTPDICKKMAQWIENERGFQTEKDSVYYG